MMLKYSFGLAEESDAIEAAVNRVLEKGLRTGDMMSEAARLWAAKPWVTPYAQNLRGHAARSAAGASSAHNKTGRQKKTPFLRRRSFRGKV